MNVYYLIITSVSSLRSAVGGGWEGAAEEEPTPRPRGAAMAEPSKEGKEERWEKRSEGKSRSRPSGKHEDLGQNQKGLGAFLGNPL